VDEEVVANELMSDGETLLLLLLPLMLVKVFVVGDRVNFGNIVDMPFIFKLI
jgi:hypothetical protein